MILLSSFNYSLIIHLCDWSSIDWRNENIRIVFLFDQESIENHDCKYKYFYDISFKITWYLKKLRKKLKEKKFFFPKRLEQNWLAYVILCVMQILRT